MYHPSYSNSTPPSLICTPTPFQMTHCVQNAPILYAHNASTGAYGKNSDDDSAASSDDEPVRDFEHPTKSDLCQETFDCKVKVCHLFPGYTRYLQNETLDMKSEPFENAQLQTFIEERNLTHSDKNTFYCKVKVTFEYKAMKGYTYYLENETLKMKSRPFSDDQLKNFIQRKILTRATWFTGME